MHEAATYKPWSAYLAKQSGRAPMYRSVQNFCLGSARVPMDRAGHERAGQQRHAQTGHDAAPVTGGPALDAAMARTAVEPPVGAVIAGDWREQIVGLVRVAQLGCLLADVPEPGQVAIEETR